VSELQLLREELNEEKRVVASLRERLQNSENQHLSSQSNAAAGELDRQREDVKHLRSEIERMEAKHNAEVGNYRSKLAEYDVQSHVQEAMKTEIEKLKRQLNESLTMERTTSSLLEDARKKIRENEVLEISRRSAGEEADKSVKKLTSQLSQVVNERNVLTSQLAAARQRATQNGASLAGVRSDLKQANDRFSTLQGEIAQYKVELDRCASQLQTANESLERERTKCEGKCLEVKSLKEEVSELTSQCNNQQKRAASAEEGSAQFQIILKTQEDTIGEFVEWNICRFVFHSHNALSPSKGREGGC